MYVVLVTVCALSGMPFAGAQENGSQPAVVDTHAAGPADAKQPAETPTAAPEETTTLGEFLDSEKKTAEPVVPGIPGAWAVVKMTFWIVVLLALFYGVARLLKRYVPVARNLFGSQTLKVVARTHLSPKQSIILVKVGQRMLVIGMTPGSMSTLSEIRDGEEMDRITRELAAGHESGSAQEFKRTMKEVSEGFQAEADGTPQPDEDAAVRTLRDELDAITRKVNLWRQRPAE